MPFPPWTVGTLGPAAWALAALGAPPAAVAHGDPVHPAHARAQAAGAPFGPLGGYSAPFEARREQPLPGKPEGLCSGDFDGDGRLDVAATLVVPGALLVWSSVSGSLDHGFETYDCADFPLAPVALPPGSFQAPGVTQRIAIASRGARTLSFAAPDCRAFALERTPRALAAGNAGGSALVVAACDGRRLEVLREGAAAPEAWKLSADLPRCAMVSTALSAVLVGFQDSTAVEAYLVPRGEPGEPAPGARLGAIQVGGIPRALAELDVDGDGDRELCVAAGDHDVLVYGAGSAGGPGDWFDDSSPLRWRADAIPTALGVGDFDGDRRDDLAVLNDFSLSLQVFTGLSTAGPERRPTFYVGQTPAGLALLDVDSDGSLDFVVGNRDPQGLGVIRGDGAGSLRIGSNFPLEDFPMTIAAAPSTASGDDGPVRLLALNAKTNTLSAVVRDQESLQVHPGVPCGSEPRSPHLAELDGNPGLDALFLVAGQGGSDLRLFRGDAAGRMEPRAALPLGFGASDLALVDVDQDGRPEILLCHANGGRVLLLEHAAALGDPAALEQGARLSVPSVPLQLVSLELDGDTVPEWACVLGSPGERVGVAWLDPRRDDRGLLELRELGFTALGGAPLEAAACDFDADGRADLAVLVTRAHDSPVGAWHPLLRGPGGAADFRVLPPVPTAQLPRGIAAGDVTGDGRAEVFVAIQTTTLVQTWTSVPGTAGLPFAMAPLDGLGAGRGPLDLVLSDADGDGLVDLCVANAFSNDVSVLRGVRR